MGIQNLHKFLKPETRPAKLDASWRGRKVGVDAMCRVVGWRLFHADFAPNWLQPHGGFKRGQELFSGFKRFLQRMPYRRTSSFGEKPDLVGRICQGYFRMLLAMPSFASDFFNPDAEFGGGQHPKSTLNAPPHRCAGCTEAP